MRKNSRGDLLFSSFPRCSLIEDSLLPPHSLLVGEDVVFQKITASSIASFQYIFWFEFYFFTLASWLLPQPLLSLTLPARGLGLLPFRSQCSPQPPLRPLCASDSVLFRGSVGLEGGNLWISSRKECFDHWSLCARLILVCVPFFAM